MALSVNFVMILFFLKKQEDSCSGNIGILIGLLKMLGKFRVNKTNPCPE